MAADGLAKELSGPKHYSFTRIPDLSLYISGSVVD